ncbi:MAG: polysaccharide deacetylase family protein [Proteobacteria bacterium]|nr:polysaccharide deacetylase family protein [Pseudomonadota bacterium]
MKRSHYSLVFQATFYVVLLLFCLSLLTCCSSGDQDTAVRQETRLVVLNYHKVGNYDDYYSVSPEQFTQQVEYMLNQGYTVISLADYRSWRQGNIELPSKVFMLTFDDGSLSDYETVYPFIKKHGLKGIFFLRTKAINTAGYLNADQIREMSTSGLCEFGSHSVTHRNVLAMAGDVLDEELTGSRNTIQSITGQDVYAFAYPNGMWDEAAKEALVKNDYQFAFTVMPGMNDATTNSFELRRITANRGSSQKIFTAWVDRDAKLYKNYYSGMLKKARKDGLTSVAKLCEEELLKL